MITRRLRFPSLETIAGSLLLLVLVIYIWVLNQGSALQTVFLWMAIIPVALSIAGVQILADARRLSTLKR